MTRLRAWTLPVLAAALVLAAGLVPEVRAQVSAAGAYVQGLVADGSAAAGFPVRIAGKDGSGNTQDVATDTSGELQVDVLTLPSNASVNVAQVGASAVVADPCEREAQIHVPIDQTSGEQLAAGTSSERIFICSLHLVTATAQNIALVSGTGTVCATSTGPIFGGTTAATGYNLAANGGLVLPQAKWSYGKTDTDADNVCLLQSGSGQISGSLSYVSAANF